MSIEKRAISYCRVSSKEQSVNFSLQSQKEACHGWAVKHGCIVIREFVNETGESAKTADRKALQDLLKFVSKKENKVDALIVWKYDRLARNMGDYIELIKLFDRLGIEIISVTEPADATASGKFMRNVLGSVAQFENDVKSERSIAGMKQAVKEGRWVWVAPVGYKYTKDVYGKSILVPNEDSIHIKHAFELAEQGIYKQTEICKELKRSGYTIAKQKLNRILRNPIYAGLIIKREWFVEPIKGIHEQLISEDIFYKIQQILDGKRPSLRPRLRNHPDFPLRNYVACPKCRKPITGSFSTSRTNKKHPYYHCRVGKCGFGNIRRDVLHVQFLQLLESIKPSERALYLFKEIVSKSYKEKLKHQEREKRTLKTRIQKLKERKEILMDRLLTEAISEEDYKAENLRIEKSIIDDSVTLNDLDLEFGDVEECIDFCCRSFSDLPKSWYDGDLKQRQRFQSFVFPKGIDYFQGEFGTTHMSLILNILQKDFVKESQMAPPVGLERPKL